jgi:hypothetical protein
MHACFVKCISYFNHCWFELAIRGRPIYDFTSFKTLNEFILEYMSRLTCTAICLICHPSLLCPFVGGIVTSPFFSVLGCGVGGKNICCLDTQVVKTIQCFQIISDCYLNHQSALGHFTKTLHSSS